METKIHRIVVEMPDQKLLKVEYYCADDSTAAKGKEMFAQLFIQLDDCICKMKIEKSIVEKDHELERIVHNKVINERGNFC